MNKEEIFDSLKGLVLALLTPEDIDEVWERRRNETVLALEGLNEEDRKWLEEKWPKWFDDNFLNRIPPEMMDGIKAMRRADGIFH